MAVPLAKPPITHVIGGLCMPASQAGPKGPIRDVHHHYYACLRRQGLPPLGWQSQQNSPRTMKGG